MIGYLCAYFRYYHPLEFVTAYLNNANNESDITSGTELARLKGVEIRPIKFRYSQSKYFPDKKTNTVYKGLSSVKYLSDGISEELYELRNEKFDTFIDFLKVNPCDSRQIDILIKLGFFSEFGKTQKLVGINFLFDKIYGKKQFKKDKCPVPKEIIERYSDQTEKMYKNFDSEAILKEMCESIEDVDMPLGVLLKHQVEYLGYIDYINPEMKKHICVIDLNTKYSPKIQAYHLDTGVVETMKISSKTYGANPFDKGIILRTTSTEKKNKSIMVNGKFCKVMDEFVVWLQSYEIVK